MPKGNYLTAREAAKELGVSRATLYAYVSRGLVRSEAVSGEPRQRRYHAEDIRRLKERKELRRNPAKAAKGALSWGIPVLESGLTLISNGKLYYRGQDAGSLALNHSLEEIASLLWTGELGAGLPDQERAPDYQPYLERLENLGRINAFLSALALAESQDPSAFDLRPESVARKGYAILGLLARIAAGENSGQGESFAGILQTAWAPAQPETTRLLDAALILCADHELNVSAFTARCVASAGASPYAAVIAGLAALQGVKHGGLSRRVEALFREVGRPEQARAVLSGRLKRGEAIPGFGHPLYPDGDPRARLLLELVQNAADPTVLDLAQAIASETLDLIGELPTLDFGLVCLRRGLGLPEDAAITIFAIGRSTGWIAHAIEQYRTDSLIRPRARYVGPQPVEPVETSRRLSSSKPAS